MQTTSPPNEPILQHLANRLLMVRAEHVLAGGDDGVIREIHAASADYYGNVEAAAEALIVATQAATRHIHAKAADARAARQVRLNEPDALAAVAEMNRLNGEAAELERKVAFSGGADTQDATARIAALVAQGVSEPAAMEAVERQDEMRCDLPAIAAKARELRGRAAVIEHQLDQLQ